MESSEEKNKLMKRFHIKDQQGNMLSGAKAFVELWKQMKSWKYLAKPFDNKIGLSILEFFYVQFLKIRPIFQKAFKIIDKH